MNEIKDKNKVLARHILKEDWNEGLNFFSNNEEYIQVGAWKYDKDKELRQHIHNNVSRTIDRTYEALYVISGSVKAYIYNLQEELVKEIIVKSGEILILLESGHGYKILEDDTKVLEVKNGPYLGAEIDRRRI